MFKIPLVNIHIKMAPVIALLVVFANPSGAQTDDLAGQRAELDRTVWSQERLAQRHESVFIELWDRLRTKPDTRQVLSELAFDRLLLGSAQTDHRDLDWDIVQSGTGGLPRVFDSWQWSALLDEWEAEGLSLEQSEWHHKRFFPPAEGPARSHIEIELHLRNGADDWRAIVNGDLVVTWSDLEDEAGHPIPATIDATNLVMSERRGSPPFSTMTVLESAALLSPLIAADLDADSHIDLLCMGANRLYRNRRGFSASEPLLTYPPQGHVEVALVADFTGDAELDAVVGGPQQLLGLYTGDSGGFPAPGVAIPTRTLKQPQAMSAGDIDADGDLDLWVGQYRVPYAGGQMPTPYYDANDGYPSYLLRNGGNGRFSDVTVQSGLADKRNRRTYGGSLADLDGDGDLDLLVVSDFAGIDVYHNDGSGTFTDVSSSHVGGEASTFGMSHAFADYNADGRLDVYVVGMSSTTARRLDYLGLGRAEFPEYDRRRGAMGFGNRLYLGAADGVFSVASVTDQVARTGWSWGVASTDLDNDGDDEIYVANGHMSGDSAVDYCSTFWTHDIYAGNSEPDPQLAGLFDEIITGWHGSGKSWNGFEHNKLFLNNEGRSFAEIGYLMGMAFEFDARTVLDMDVDGDGRKDLLVSEWSGSPKSERVHVMRNNWPGENNWLGVRLRGAGGVSPIGARIILRTAQGTSTQWIYTGESFDAQRSSSRHFGLGEIDHVESVEVVWPGGQLSTLVQPELNRYHDLRPQIR